jgi:hypothetical protein
LPLHARDPSLARAPRPAAPPIPSRGAAMPPAQPPRPPARALCDRVAPRAAGGAEARARPLLLALLALSEIAAQSPPPPPPCPILHSPTTTTTTGQVRRRDGRQAGRAGVRPGRHPRRVRRRLGQRTFVFFRFASAIAAPPPPSRGGALTAPHQTLARALLFADIQARLPPPPSPPKQPQTTIRSRRSRPPSRTRRPRRCVRPSHQRKAPRAASASTPLSPPWLTDPPPPPALHNPTGQHPGPARQVLRRQPGRRRVPHLRRLSGARCLFFESPGRRRRGAPRAGRKGEESGGGSGRARGGGGVCGRPVPPSPASSLLSSTAIPTPSPARAVLPAAF